MIHCMYYIRCMYCMQYIAARCEGAKNSKVAVAGIFARLHDEINIRITFETSSKQDHLYV